MLRHGLRSGAEHALGLDLFHLFSRQFLGDLLLVIVQDAFAFLLESRFGAIAHDAIEDHTSPLQREEEAERHVFGLLSPDLARRQFLEKLEDLFVHALPSVLAVSPALRLDDAEEFRELDIASIVVIDLLDDFLYLGAVLAQPKSNEWIFHLIYSDTATAVIIELVEDLPQKLALMVLEEDSITESTGQQPFAFLGLRLED